MTIRQVTLRARRKIAEGTMSFEFSKPGDFAFKPGQAIDVVLPAAQLSDATSNRHAFSIVSAPFEGTITIATRMRDSTYKRALNSLQIGASVAIDGPFGSLTLHGNRARPAILIAGGIGITPFMSIIRQATNDRLPQKLLLLYSNHRPEDAAFLDELTELDQVNGDFQLLATMTAMNRSSQTWLQLAGRIDGDLIRKVSRGNVTPVYYVTGSPSMVSSMRKQLNGAGIDDDDIRSEEFLGY